MNNIFIDDEIIIVKKKKKNHIYEFIDFIYVVTGII